MECVLPVLFDVIVLPAWSCLHPWHRLPPPPPRTLLPQLSSSPHLLFLREPVFFADKKKVQSQGLQLIDYYLIRCLTIALYAKYVTITSHVYNAP